MKRIIVLLTFLLMSSMVSAAMLSEDAFTYYRFGVGPYFLTFAPDKAIYSQGETIIINYDLENRMGHPLAEAKVRLQVFYNHPTLGEQIIDEFFTEEGLYLADGAVRSAEYFYELPSTAPVGRYTIKAYVQSDDYFNLAGLSILAYGPPGAPAIQAEFSVEGTASSYVFIDKEGVLLNGAPYIFLGKIPIFDDVNDVVISVPIINQGAAKQVEVIGAVYRWDDSSADQYLFYHTKIESLSLTSEGKGTFTLPINGLEPGVYQVKVQADTGDEKVVLKMRFSIRGNEARIYYQGLTGFPLKRGESQKVFATYSASTDYSSSFGGKIAVKLEDENGRVLMEDASDVTFTSAPTGISSSFSPTEDISYAVLTVTLTRSDGKVLDEREVVYDLSAFEGVERSLSLDVEGSQMQPGDIVKYTIDYTAGDEPLEGSLILYLLGGDGSVHHYEPIELTGGEYPGTLVAPEKDGSYTLRVRDPEHKMVADKAVFVTREASVMDEREPAPVKGVSPFLMLALIAAVAIGILLVVKTKTSKD